MNVLIAVLLSVFAVTCLSAPTMGAGWFWDSGNALGFCAFGGLLYLTVTSSQRIDIRAHEALSYVVFALAVVHAFWFLLGDAAMREFMKLDAPYHMWLGALSVMLLGTLMIVARLPDRQHVHKGYREFKRWHRIGSIAAIAAATVHIAGSGFYLNTWYQIVLFVSIVLAAIYGRAYWKGAHELRVVSIRAYLLVGASVGALFVAMRNWPL